MEQNFSIEQIVKQLVKDEVAAETGRILEVCREEAKDSKELLTMDEASSFLGLSKSYVYKMTSAGLIPHYKPLGKVINFERSVLKEWIRQHPGKTKDDIVTAANNYVSGKPLIA